VADTNKYNDITNISNWYNTKLGLRHVDVRNYIQDLYNATGSPAPVWDNLTIDEKKIVASLFLVDKTHRDEVLTQDEQDEHDHYRLYHWLSDDVLDRFNGTIHYKTTPKSIDYKKDLSIRLHPEYVFDNYGFLTSVIYYENLSVSLNQFGFPVYTFTNPVVKYEATYTLDVDTGYVTTREIYRHWMKLSGVWGSDPKTSWKIYNSKQAREEGSRRRKNLINNILIDTVGLLLMTSPSLTTVAETESDAMPFLQEVQPAMSLYYESGAKLDGNGNPCLLIQKVTDSVYTKLDNVISASPYMTIRSYIIMKLDPQ